MFFTWMDETLFPNYFPLKEFNGVDNLGVLHKQFFADMANARIGPARLRQVRTKYGMFIYLRFTLRNTLNEGVYLSF